MVALGNRIKHLEREAAPPAYVTPELPPAQPWGAALALMTDAETNALMAAWSHVDDGIALTPQDAAAMLVFARCCKQVGVTSLVPAYKWMTNAELEALVLARQRVRDGHDPTQADLAAAQVLADKLDELGIPWR